TPLSHHTLTGWETLIDQGFTFNDKNAQKLFGGKSIEFGEVLGKGVTGAVYLASLQGCSTIFAVKVQVHGASLIKEWRIRQQAGPPSPHLITFYVAFKRTFPSGTTLYFIIMEHGTCASKLSVDTLKTQRWEILASVAKGLEILHAKRIGHYDIKLENTIICQGKAKLADFGLSDTLSPNLRTGGSLQSPSAIYSKYLFEFSTLENHPRLVSIKEDFTDVALEEGFKSVKDANMRGAEDVWALGVLSYQMLSGELHYNPTGRVPPRASFGSWPSPVLPVLGDAQYIRDAMVHLQGVGESLRELRGKAFDRSDHLGGTQQDAQLWQGCLISSKDRISLSEAQSVIELAWTCRPSNQMSVPTTKGKGKAKESVKAGKENEPPHLVSQRPGSLSRMLTLILKHSSATSTLSTGVSLLRLKLSPPSSPASPLDLFLQRPSSPSSLPTSPSGPS
ncbi:hypothetical protein P7C70_g9252, partial [Phenoliferia sp. Uapishka_3]